MFKQLFLTELLCNTKILGLSLLVNVVSFAYLGYLKAEPAAFVGATLLSFYILLIVSSSQSSDEKRTRLFTQLPVSTDSVFFAGWAMVMVWLIVQVCCWGLYSQFFPADALRFATFTECLNSGLGVAIVIALISIGIDLGAFRPAYVQWVYIVSMVFLLVVASRLGFSVGLDLFEDAGVRVLPFDLMGDSLVATGAALTFFLAAFLADYLIFKHSDSYLG